MDESASPRPQTPAEHPRAVYTRRLEARRAVADALARRDDRIANARMLAFLAGVAIALPTLAWERLHDAWLLLPAAAFAALVTAHAAARRRRAEALRAVDHYARGLARLDGTWPGAGTPGTRFADPDHPYALDLDLFGEGSLFERLCLARTAPGEASLARWLLAPAGADEIRARQAAVAELAPRVELREELDRLGTAVRTTVEPEELARWGAASPVLPGARGLRVLLYVLPATTLGLLAAWALGPLPPGPFLVALAAQGAFAFAFRERVARVVGTVQRPSRELEVLALVLGRLEREPFQSPRLTALQARLKAEGETASQRVHELVRRVDLLAARENQFFIPIALLLLWSTHLAFSLEAWRQAFGARLGDWMDAVGELEALSSLGAYAFENPEDPFPEILDAPQARYEGEALRHPLMPRDRFVANDVSLGATHHLLVVSGSNMSGKSTLLRTVGANAVLAFAGAPVRAARLALTPLAVGATLRIQDSLREGASRFYAEITRLKQVVDLASGRPPLLFLLDEVLSGTNSHDRRIGAGSILRTLVERGAVGLVTTHDLALADIAERLGPLAENVHFEDRLEGDRLEFDYRMRPGVVRRSNAIALMRAVGLSVTVDDAAPVGDRPEGRTP